MVIVKILGGFGNQLSAYACGYALARERKEELLLDVSDYYNGYIFPYQLDFLNIPAYRKVKYLSKSIMPMGQDNIPKSLTSKTDLIVSEEQGIKIKEDLIRATEHAKNPYLLGYWGLDFAQGYENEIQEMFVLREPSATVDRFMRQIGDGKRGESIALHIRRKDFTVNNDSSGADFFKAAIVLMLRQHPGAYFYFFSDDIEFAKETFGDAENYRYIKIFGGVQADLEEFFCLSACNHRILSRKSTFGLWANILCKHKGKTGIIWKRDGDCPETQEGVTYLSDAQIQELSVQYQKKERSPYKMVAPDFITIEKCLENDQNQKALELLDKLSFDYIQVKKEEYVDLISYKGVANAQSGRCQEALQCLHRQEQYSRDSFDFHYNYFQVLEQFKPRRLEGVVQAAMTYRCSNDSSLKKELEEYYKDSRECLDMFKLLSETRRKHFVIMPLLKWHYYAKYLQSIAILLRKMGHDITYLNPPALVSKTGETDAEEAVTTEKAVEAGYNTVQRCNILYDCGFNIYTTLYEKRPEETVSFAQPFIKAISKKYENPTYVIGRQPMAFPFHGTKNYAKYIFLDFCGREDSEEKMAESMKKQALLHMILHADASIFTDKERYKRYSFLADTPVLFQDEKKKKELDYIDELVTDTMNYMNSDDMIRLAALLIKVADRLR